MKIADLFPTRFISASDVLKCGAANSDFVIAKVVQEDAFNPVTRKAEKVPVVYFKGAMKGHRLRKSEHKKLEQKLGDDSDAWVGKSVKLIIVDSQVGKGVRIQPSKETTDGQAS